MKSAVSAPTTRDGEVDQRRGEPERLPALALLELLGENRDERRLDRGIREQAANQVRDLERDRERGHRALDPEVGGGNDLPHDARDARERRGDREEGSRAGKPARALGLLAACRGADLELSLLGRLSQGAPRRSPAARVGSGEAPLSCARRWQTSPPRRSGSSAPPASDQENRRLQSAVKTHFRRLENAVADGDGASADTEHRLLVSRIDKAVQKGALHANNGARKKSRAARIRARAAA